MRGKEGKEYHIFFRDIACFVLNTSNGRLSMKVVVLLVLLPSSWDQLHPDQTYNRKSIQKIWNYISYKFTIYGFIPILFSIEIAIRFKNLLLSRSDKNKNIFFKFFFWEQNFTHTFPQTLYVCVEMVSVGFGFAASTITIVTQCLLPFPLVCNVVLCAVTQL